MCAQIADHIQARPPKSLKSTTKPLLGVTRPRSFHDAEALPISSSLNVDPVHLPMTSQRRLLELDRRLAGISTGFQKGSGQMVSSEPVFDQTIEDINMTEHDGVVGSVSKGKQKAWTCSPSSSRSRSRSKSRSRQPSSRLKSRSSPKNQRAPGEDYRNDHLSDTLDEDLHRIIKEDKVLYERILRYEVCRLAYGLWRKLLTLFVPGLADKL